MDLWLNRHDRCVRYIPPCLKPGKSSFTFAGASLYTRSRDVCSSVWTVNCHPQLLAPRFLLPSQRSLTQKHTDLCFYRRRGLFCQFNRLNKSAYVIWNACVRGAFKVVFNWNEKLDTRKFSPSNDGSRVYHILDLV